MSKPRLWITRRLSDATLERATRDYDVVINHDDLPGTAEQLIAASAEFDAIIPCHSEHFSAEVVAQFSDRLKIVANHSVGVDHCNLPALKGRGIAVTNTPDVLSDATAELAMLLMLGAARHAVAGDRIRAPVWASSEWDVSAAPLPLKHAGSIWKSTITTVPSCPPTKQKVRRTTATSKVC